MLGWFKRKFGKKKDEPAATQTVPVELDTEEISAEAAESVGLNVAEEVVTEEPATETTAPDHAAILAEAAGAGPAPPTEEATVVEEEPASAPEPPSVESRVPEAVQPEEVDAAPAALEPTPVETAETVADLAEIGPSEPTVVVPAGAVKPQEVQSSSAAEAPAAPSPDSTVQDEEVASEVERPAVFSEETLPPDTLGTGIDAAEVEAVSEPEATPAPEAITGDATVESVEEPELEAVPAAEILPETEILAESEESSQRDVIPEPTAEFSALDALEESTPPDEDSAAQPSPAVLEQLQPLEEMEGIVPAPPISARTQEKPGGRSMFQRLQERLGKTRDAFIYRIDRLFLGKKEIDQDLFEQLEEILITADLGVATTLELVDVARKKVKRDQLSDPQALKAIIRDQILAYIEASDQPAELVLPEEGPFVIMVVGVNGVGKTTTIGKIAAKFVRSGQSVVLVAADTFRAAAIDQLRIWGERVGVRVIAQKPNADPSSVAFDGLDYGVAHGVDVIIIDTAGRLHTSVNLMEELKKIKRVIGKKMEGAPHEVMLVLDATTGQNGIAQAKMFHEAVGVTGLTLTKLDGTAKGGIVANVCREIRIPVRFIGIGEQLDDLRDFDAREFVDALFASQTGGASSAP
ncbi:MAG: signal recognition particle-docking protein FtsY [Desulfobulbus sp.]|jgi:fused signal recognition particle receptor|nr:signal recognition particle-docking protein FtsY [Desulfobulbus sp.]